MERSVNTKREPLPPVFRRTIGPLIKELINPKSLKNDLFFALLLILMKENDFVLVKTYNGGAIDIVDFMLQLRINKVYEYEALFKLNGKDLHIRLIASYLNDVVLINASMPDLCNETFSICLLINRYLNSSEQFDIPTTFINIEELSTLFKDKIITSVKSDILNHYNSPGCSLFSVPEEVAHEIMARVPVVDIINIARTCTRLSHIVTQDRLWRRLLKRDFPEEGVDTEKCFLETYKDLYVARKIERQNCAHNIERTFREYVLYSRPTSECLRWNVTP